MFIESAQHYCNQMNELRFSTISINSDTIKRSFDQFGIEFNEPAESRRLDREKILYSTEDRSILIGFTYRTRDELPFTFVKYTDEHKDLMLLLRLSI